MALVPDFDYTRYQINTKSIFIFGLMLVSGELAEKSKWDVLSFNNMGSDHFPTLGMFEWQLKTEDETAGI